MLVLSQKPKEATVLKILRALSTSPNQTLPATTQWQFQEEEREEEILSLLGSGIMSASQIVFSEHTPYARCFPIYQVN